jgi:hypothetical protein
MKCGASPMILGNCRVTIVEIAARLGINVVCPWSKPLYVTLTQHKWTTEPHLQHDQASAVLPIIQRKYSSIALFNSPHTNSECLKYFLLLVAVIIDYSCTSCFPLYSL